MPRALLALLLIANCAVLSAAAQESRVTLQVPEQVVAGAGFSISTGGSGDATFYLIGPSHVARRKIRLGSPIQVGPDEVRDAGLYLAVLRKDNASTHARFYVVAAEPAALSFLARPSRLPVALPGGISGVVYPFDKFHNLVVQPKTVQFVLSVGDAPPLSRTIVSKHGVAWIRMDSSRKAGAAQFVALIGDVSARRVVQQVASDPCNLRMTAQHTAKGILVQTDPVSDCTGNTVPDGTIVSFTALSSLGKTTVDAPIKRGVAKAELPLSGNAVISVASGVVMGNDIRWGGGR